MITELRVKGRMVYRCNQNECWVEIDGQLLEDILPRVEAKKAVEITAIQMLVDDEYVNVSSANYCPAIGERVSEEEYKKLREEHFENRTTFPLYEGEWILTDWGQVDMVVYFEHP